MTTDLALHATVRELCAAFVSAERDVRAAFAQIVAAEERLGAAFAMGEHYARIHVSACGSSYRDNFKDPDEAVKLMARGAWRAIVERFELRRFMSIKRWEELTKAIDEDGLPSITEEHVMGFLFAQLSQAREHLTEAVHEVFECQRNRGRTRTGRLKLQKELKPNSELEVPGKVILGYVVSRRWTGKGFEVDYRRRQHLVALENVFRALDGRGTIPGYQSALETAISAAEGGEGETDLFTFRACINHNLHLTFRRPDLLERFNQIAGGKRLRPAETEEQRLRREVAEARAENERLRRSA